MEFTDRGSGRGSSPASRASLILGLYAGLGALAFIIGGIRGDWDIYRVGGVSTGGRLLLSPLCGLAVGLAVVFASRLAVHRFDWARRLHRDFRGLLGHMGEKDILVLALASSVGEELLFRGALQPWIGLVPSAVVFALLHIGPGTRFLPWTASALVVGLGFGFMAAQLGDIGGPIVAHFTINFMNLQYIPGRAAPRVKVAPDWGDSYGGSMRSALLALGLAVLALAWSARADEMSGDDKLRLLYSHRFTFTRDGVPLVTVEIMSGQSKVRLSADDGLRVLPEGDGGPEISAGPSWTITAEHVQPARLRFWTVVSRTATDDEIAEWKQRGYQVASFETGVVFGVEGEMIDSRETLLGIAPEADEAAALRTGKAIADKWKVGTSVYPELVEGPRGTLVAKDAASGAVVKNEGVLWFSPSSTSGTITVADVVHGGGGSQRDAEKKETRGYFGRVYVTLGTDGKLTVVNAIPEDRLLMGLVPSEIFPDAPAEALRAQAVAARTELLAKIGTRHFQDPYLVCSSQHCQVYGGVGLEDERTSAAVKKTRGEVLMRDGGGGLVQAYYSASCGGFSEHNENIWGLPPDPSLRGHLDAGGAGLKQMSKWKGGVTDANVKDFLATPAEASYCGKTKYAKGRYRWTVTMSAADLDALVAADLPALGHVKELRPVTRGISGRIVSLEIVGDKGKAVVDGDLKIRRLLGGLKSTLFVVELSGKTWTFSGAGFGHGVGLCQTGAIGMAQDGSEYRKILQHYYPGSHVHSLY